MRDQQVKQHLAILAYHGVHQDCQYYLKIREIGIITTAGTTGAWSIFLFASLIRQLLMNVKYQGVSLNDLKKVSVLLKNSNVGLVSVFTTNISVMATLIALRVQMRKTVLITLVYT